jgi:hypothetical protein
MPGLSVRVLSGFGGEILSMVCNAPTGRKVALFSRKGVRFQEPSGLPAVERCIFCISIEGNKMASSVLIGILITFLVIVLILYLVQRLPIDGRARQIIQVVVIVIGIIALLKYLAVF